MNDFWNYLGGAIVILALTLGMGTCQYVIDNGEAKKAAAQCTTQEPQDDK